MIGSTCGGGNVSPVSCENEGRQKSMARGDCGAGNTAPQYLRWSN